MGTDEQSSAGFRLAPDAHLLYWETIEKRLKVMTRLLARADQGKNSGVGARQGYRCDRSRRCGASRGDLATGAGLLRALRSRSRIRRRRPGAPRAPRCRLSGYTAEILAPKSTGRCNTPAITLSTPPCSLCMGTIRRFGCSARRDEVSLKRARGKLEAHRACQLARHGSST